MSAEITQPASLAAPHASYNGIPGGSARYPSVSVVIPTLNEAENLRHVLPRIPAWVSEVIIVDGLSTDSTVAEALRILPNARIVLEERPGKGIALRAGFDAARGEIIVILDADGSMSPAEIPLYVGGLLAGADLVKGTRFAQGAGTADMSLLRRFGNWGLTRLVRVAHGGNFSDLCYGYIAFWRTALQRLDLDCDGFEIETLIEVRALRRGMRIYELPSYEAKRIHGRTNLRTFPDGWRVLRTITRETRSPVTSPYREERGFAAHRAAKASVIQSGQEHRVEAQAVPSKTGPLLHPNGNS